MVTSLSAKVPSIVTILIVPMVVPSILLLKVRVILVKIHTLIGNVD